jgi:23S rRNA (cytidine1920-2'-O)/16S rRNA (cytidine1409-2'-O)-methyltransferase
MAKEKKRLDVLLHERYPHYTRAQIQSFIIQGKARTDNVIHTKAGSLFPVDAAITFEVEEPRFVSRAGYKLEKALDEFGINVDGLVALDAGISTGGFTDCLLQRGVARVYGVDVGYGQVHEKLRNDPRVVLMEKVNLRHLNQLPEKLDLVTLDLSFISLLKVMPAVVSLLKPSGIIITLIKPQFEAERRDVARGGIVKNPAVHQEVIAKVTLGMHELGFERRGLLESPIKGGTRGNVEFLAYFARAQ